MPPFCCLRRLTPSRLRHSARRRSTTRTKRMHQRLGLRSNHRSHASPFDCAENHLRGRGDFPLGVIEVHGVALPQCCIQLTRVDPRHVPLVEVGNVALSNFVNARESTPRRRRVRSRCNASIATSNLGGGRCGFHSRPQVGPAPHLAIEDLVSALNDDLNRVVDDVAFKAGWRLKLCVVRCEAPKFSK